MGLISVHTPKSGGTSVRSALIRAFGDGFRAYSEDPANPCSPRNLDPIGYLAGKAQLPPDAMCIHGHFHPGHFDARGHVLATILREPVDNIISIYFFWKRLAPQGSVLHDYFLAKSLDVIGLAQLPLLQRLFSRTYLGGFDMSRFDLVGRHDARAEALQRLSSLVGRPLDPGIHENATPPDPERDELAADFLLRAKLESILIEDIRFYEAHAHRP